MAFSRAAMVSSASSQPMRSKQPEPFGPLRFEAAYPLLKADRDKVEYFRFSVGTAF